MCRIVAVAASSFSRFRYLEHIITQDQKDDDDIKREICKMFIRTNIEAHKFGKCSFIMLLC